MLVDICSNFFTSEDWESSNEVLNIIKKEKITIIIPTGDSDIKHFYKNRKLLEKLGVSVFMSDYDSIIKCQAKKLFFDRNTTCLTKQLVIFL